MKSGRLVGIEAARGVAALLVLGLHARDHLFQNFQAPAPFADLFVFGHAGVDFFFVLSGFIILYVHRKDIGRPERLGHYLQRRFTRIYPFYWVVLFLSLTALMVSIHYPFPPFARIGSSALLLPVSSAPIVSVAWTLQNEMTFYAVFAVLVWNRRMGQAVFFTWSVLLLWNLSTHAVSGPVLDRFNLEFSLGMTAAWTLQRTSVPVPWLVLVAGTVLFFATGYAEDVHLMPELSSVTHGGYAAGAALIILGLVETERQGHLHVPRLMFALGGASYAIYLTHLLTIGAVWQVMLRSGLASTLPLWAQFLLLFLAGATGGWVLHRLVEQPALSFTRRQIDFWRSGRTTIQATNETLR